MSQTEVVGTVYAVLMFMSLAVITLDWWFHRDGEARTREFYDRVSKRFKAIARPLKTHARNALSAYERLPQVAPRHASGRRADRSSSPAVRCVRGIGRAARRRRGRRAASTSEPALA